MGLLNSFCCCCYWCGSPVGGLHGGEPFEESLKGSCVHLPRHPSAAWKEFLHDPAFIFFSSWCLSYCRQGRIRSVFPRLMDLIVFSSTELSKAHVWILQCKELGWCCGSVQGQAPCSATRGGVIHLQHSSGGEQSGGLCTLSGGANGTSFKQIEEQEMNGFC